jgi:predicted Rossmann-fold nucleotide-binding protein
MGALTLIQTKKITNFPVLLFGSDYWSGLIQWLRERVLVANNITQEDVDSIHIVDEPERVVEIVCEWHDKALVVDGDEDEEPPKAEGA